MRAFKVRGYKGYRHKSSQYFLVNFFWPGSKLHCLHFPLQLTKIFSRYGCALPLLCTAQSAKLCLKCPHDRASSSYHSNFTWQVLKLHWQHMQKESRKSIQRFRLLIYPMKCLCGKVRTVKVRDCKRYQYKSS